MYGTYSFSTRIHREFLEAPPAAAWSPSTTFIRLMDKPTNQQTTNTAPQKAALAKSTFESSITGPSNVARSTTQVSSPQVAVCNCGPNGRNLVICIDGALSQVESKVHPFPHFQRLRFMRCLLQNSTVFELYNQIKRSQRQVVYYDRGVGSYKGSSLLKQFVNNVIDSYLVDV